MSNLIGLIADITPRPKKGKVIRKVPAGTNMYVVNFGGKEKIIPSAAGELGSGSQVIVSDTDGGEQVTGTTHRRSDIETIVIIRG